MARIILLKDASDYAPILAYWAYGEWYVNRSFDFNLLIKAYQDRIDDSKLPVSLVAIENGIPVGMVSLKENDVWSRKDLNPWLNSLYVVPEFRNRGIGKLLIEKVKKKAMDLNISRLFLFADADNIYLNNYYNNIGWTFLKDEKGNDENKIKIYYYNI
jgi:GNAT superfamily N-acetyltransferase